MTDKELAPDGAFCIEPSTAEYLSNILDIELEIESKISQLSKEDKQRIGTKLIIETCETYNEIAQITKDARITVAQNIRDKNTLNPDYVAPERFTTEMGVDGMVHIIRDKGTVEGAYDVVAEKHNKDVILLKDAATKEHYNRSHIIEKTSTVVPEQLAKVREEGLMTMLEKPTTINSMFDNTYITMKVLGELDTLREKVNQLEVRQVITETRVDQIGEQLGITTGGNIELALKLKTKGLSNKAIAKELGVVPKTITRWLKSVKHKRLNVT